jgi:signal transduction histidine kinase/ActR/RegA family two-component response regulator
MSSRDSVILILAPLGQDTAVIESMFKQSGLNVRVCGDLPTLVAALATASGAVLAQETLLHADFGMLSRWVKQQPPWSDFPFVLLSSREGLADRSMLQALGNVTVLEWPMHQTTLLSAVQSAMRARQRQFEAGDQEAALEARVATRTRDLEQALAKLQAEAVERERVESALRHSQKLEAIGQLTGGVAHDFNNLLTVIRSGIDFLRRDDLPEERRRRYIDAIRVTADRAAVLTSQLLAFARRQPLKAQVFDAAEKIGATLEMLRTVVGSRIKLNLEVGTAVFIKADVVQFETALINMAVNSRDAMNGAGAITIRIAEAEGIPPIRGHAGVQGAYATISVSDTGPGVSPKLLERIFEPFFTTKEVGKGTGLGLSQVYGFAKQSGGNVHVENREGLGATFTIYLPRSTRAELTLSAAEEHESVHGSARGRVLMVEDNEQLGEYTAQMLEDLGYSVSLVANASAALGLLEAEPHGFDVVFSDVVMPGPIDGLQLAYLLADQRPDLPVVLTTGYSDALTDGVVCTVELLRKPYSVETLSRLMARVIALRSTQAREPVPEPTPI